MTLPVPQFSKSNLYWRDRRIAGVLPEYQPRNTAVDFLYATSHEIHARDIHGAYCVRSATVNTLRLNFLFSIRKQIKEITQ